jgi:hypothetical protein
MGYLKMGMTVKIAKTGFKKTDVLAHLIDQRSDSAEFSHNNTKPEKKSGVKISSRNLLICLRSRLAKCKNAYKIILLNNFSNMVVKRSKIPL